MTQDATTTQTPSQPSISRLAYHCVESLVAQVAILPVSFPVKPVKADGDPARFSVINFPALLIRANYACARILDMWQGYAYAHLKSMG